MEFSRDHYKDLVEQASDLIQCVDSTGVFVFVNAAWKNALGYSSDDVRTMRLWDIIHQNSILHCQTVFQQVIAGEKVDLVEAIFKKKNGEPLYVEGSVNCRFDADGNVISTRGIFRDMTQKKKHELEALRYKSLLEERTVLQYLISQTAATLIDRNLDFDEMIIQALSRFGNHVAADRVYVFAYDFNNRVCNNTYEWCQEGIEPQIDRLQQVDLDMMSEWVVAHTKGETVYIPDVQTLSPKDGVRILLEPQGVKSLIAVPMVKDGQCSGFIGFDSVREQHRYTENEQQILQDLSALLFLAFERISMEQAIRQSEEKYRDLVENLNEIVYILDDAARIQFVSSNIEFLSGYSFDEIRNMRFFEFVHPEDRVGRVDDFLQTLNGISTRSDYRFILKDQRIIWVSTQAKAIVKNGIPIGIRGVLTDITERKSAEERLEIGERNFRLFFESMEDIVFVLDEQGKIQFGNSAASEKLGYLLSELYSMHVTDLFIFEQWGESVWADTQNAKQKLETCLLPFKTQDGRILPVETRFQVGEWGGRSCIYSISKDLSLEQEAMRRFNRIFENNPALMALCTVSQGVFSEENSSFLDRLGYSRDEVIGSTSEILDLFQHPKTFQLFLMDIQQKGTARDCHMKVVAKDNRVLDGLFSGEIIEIQNEKFYLLVMLDITEREKMEVQNRFLSMIMMNVSDSIVVSDTDFKITHINKQVEELYGYTSQELIGQTPVIFNPISSHVAMLKELHETVSQGQTFSGEFTNQRKNGSTFMCDLTVSPIIGEDGQIRAYVGIQRDITEKARMREELLESHNRYDQLAKQSRYIAWETDSHGRFRYVSHVVRDVLGFEPADLVGKKYFYDLYAKNKKESLKASSYGIFTSGSSFENLVIPLETKIGDLVYVSVNGIGLFDNNRKLLGFRGSFTDITEKKQLEDAVFNEKELFRTTLLSVGDGIISTDNHGSIIMMNKVAEDVTGWTLTEARGKPLQEVLVQRKNPETKLDSFLIARNGTERSIETNTSPIQDIQGNANGMVLVFRDCTERKKKQEEIAFLSYHDQLTGVFNRRYYEQRIRMFADGINHPMALVMADVNGLKLINDGFGHNAGDQLLQRIARTLIRCSGPDDVVARIGGDEFIMLLPRTDAVGTQKIIARILQELAEAQNRMFEISISFGFAIMDSPEETYGSVFKLAEDRMYRNKLSESSSARSKTIDSLLYSLFEKSKREMMHSRRVGAICETMALKLQFPSNEVSEMKTAGLMHDIGKMAISDNILNKSDPLTDYEWLEIKRHPEVGYNILSAVNKYAPLAEYVLCHHERWDGKGYPRGLAGEEIPIQARIIAIADAYDAMVSERPYKKRSCKEDAVNEFLACAGKQYDPELVKLFISCLR